MRLQKGGGTQIVTPFDVSLAREFVSLATSPATIPFTGVGGISFVKKRGKRV